MVKTAQDFIDECNPKRPKYSRSKERSEDPINFSGKVLRDLSDNPEFKLSNFKKRYSLKLKK